jgi:murein DD-endopeptidase MepM/ murein hydrolase activator NlpD
LSSYRSAFSSRSLPGYKLLLAALAVSVVAMAPLLPDWPPSDYQRPVEAPVVDSFRPPVHVGAPGNRGLEYDTTPGTPVRAAKAGTVTFAGPVGGSWAVTILHVDGLRTSYSFLAATAVAAGESVTVGQVIGLTGGSFHFGARVGDHYVDPASLFGPVRSRARLVSSVQEPDTHPASSLPPGTSLEWLLSE